MPVAVFRCFKESGRRHSGHTFENGRERTVGSEARDFAQITDFVREKLRIVVDLFTDVIDAEFVDISTEIFSFVLVYNLRKVSGVGF